MIRTQPYTVAMLPRVGSVIISPESQARGIVYSIEFGTTELNSEIRVIGIWWDNCGSVSYSSNAVISYLDGSILGLAALGLDGPWWRVEVW